MIIINNSNKTGRRVTRNPVLSFVTMLLNSADSYIYDSKYDMMSHGF